MFLWRFIVIIGVEYTRGLKKRRIDYVQAFEPIRSCRMLSVKVLEFFFFCLLTFIKFVFERKREHDGTITERNKY